MSGTIPPIPPPFRTSSGNSGSPNVNRVDTMPTTTDPINTMTKTNDSDSDVEEDQRTINEFMADLNAEYHEREPLPPIPKLIGVVPSGTLESLISLSDLTLNMADLTLDTPVPKKTRASVKVSHAYVIKKKTEKSPSVPKPCSDKKADSSTEQLLLTLREKVKGLKRQIKIPSGTPPSSSQPSSFKATKKKTWFGPSVKKTLCKLKAQSPLKPSLKKAPMIPKPFKEYKYCEFDDHHSDHYRDCSRNMTGIKQYLHIYLKELGPKLVLEIILQETQKGMAQ
ncbi:hypothetical protein Tco_0766250 [Tanacetum coccineum]